MPTLTSFDYAVIRVVPRVEREEFVNAGVIVFCLEQRSWSRVQVDEAAAASALARARRATWCAQHLEAFPRICAGGPDGGPIARLSLRERFHWLVAPRSTIIQVSPVHSGLCETPQREVESS